MDVLTTFLGDGTITCGCYNAGKTRAYFQWNGLNSLYSSYSNVELDSIFVLLSYSCSEGSPDLWNGIDGTSFITIYRIKLTFVRSLPSEQRIFQSREFDLEQSARTDLHHKIKYLVRTIASYY